MATSNPGPGVSANPNEMQLRSTYDINGKLLQILGPGQTVAFDPANVAITGGVIAGGSVTGGSIRGRSVATLKAFKAVAPQRSTFRGVMATPPTTTFTTVATIAASILWPTVTATGAGTTYQVSMSAFSIGRAGNPRISNTGFPDYNFVLFQNINYGGGSLQTNQWLASFIHDGAAIEISVKGQTGALMVKVDDQYISLTPQAVPNDGAQYRYYIPFGSVKARRIDVIGVGNVPFGGIYTAATDTVIPAPLRGPRTIVMGDSFTEGIGSNNPDSWVNSFADAMGWDDVWSSGVGSTGYLATIAAKIKYRDRFATDVAAFAPDVIIFTGGINDNGSFNGSQVSIEAQALFALAVALCPNALIVTCAPFWKGGASQLTANIISIRDALKAQTAAVGGLFIDALEMPLSPVGYVPQVTSLSASVAASATSVLVTNPPAARGTYKFPDGTRFQCKSAAGTGPYTITTDGPIQTAQVAGVVVTQVGDSFLTGTGRIGTVAGYGNSDLYVIADGTHPSPVQHAALGQVVAMLLTAALS